MELKLRLIPVGAWVELGIFCSGVSVHLEVAVLECSVDTAMLSVLASSYGVFRGVEAAFYFGGRGGGGGVVGFLTRFDVFWWGFARL